MDDIEAKLKSLNAFNFEVIKYLAVVAGVFGLGYGLYWFLSKRKK